MRDKCYICRNSHSNQIFFRSPAVVAILFVVFRRPCLLSLQSIGPDLMNIDPSAPQECIALYRIADPSPNTSSYYQSPSANPRIDLNTSSALPFRSSRPLRFPSGSSNPTTQCRGATGNVHSHICFASVIQSEGTRTTSSAPAFLPVDQILVEFVPGGSGSNVTKEKIQDNANPIVYETV